MKKKIVSLLLTGVLAAAVAGCGSKEKSDIGASAVEISSQTASTVQAPAESSTASSEAPVQGAEVPEGMYLSELTGEPIDESLKDQRPIAAMVDNEKMALPHYGTAEADVVYELMNSTKNDRITRLMCLVKDWEKIEQLGSIRSTRPTNIVLAAEWNAVVCHDGGPFYINDYFAREPFKEHFSGGFKRVVNGKATEFTEYIMTGNLDSKFDASGYSKTYNENRFKDDSHFNFTPYGTEVDLSSMGTVSDVKEAVLPFKHNQSTLKYNESTGKYEYNEYGSLHKDAEDGEPLAFTNVILQDTSFAQLDENGYLVYNYLNTDQPGYYLTGGKCIPIKWSKTSETDHTRYYDKDGNEITINTGKTYIGLIPGDSWDNVQLN
jgi:hypothetical protein